MLNRIRIEIDRQKIALEKSFAEFLESTPPNQFVIIPKIIERYDSSFESNWRLIRPKIHLVCENESCNGTRIFRCDEDNDFNYFNFHEFNIYSIKYKCSNCQCNVKVFSIAVGIYDENSKSGVCFKLGEYPFFGPVVSSRLIKLIGPDRDVFLKGRKCENQGMGVGAFTYYRRVVENQKNRILDQIIKVSEVMRITEDKIKVLKDAKSERSFSKAIDKAKDVLPENLYMNGHNPLKLLHSALSEGVHDLSDEECLESAESIRIVLGELSDRISQALKDNSEIKKAISSLMNKKRS